MEGIHGGEEMGGGSDHVPCRSLLHVDGFAAPDKAPLLWVQGPAKKRTRYRKVADPDPYLLNAH